MRTVHAAAVVVFALVLVFAAAPASAVTVEQIVALSKSGVSEAVILALLDRDRTVLTIEPEQLAALKREGLSDTLLMAMLRSGRDDAEDAARAVSAANAATIQAAIDATPAFVVIGHGPERPDTVHTEDFYLGLRDGVRLPSSRPLGGFYGTPLRSPYRTGFRNGAFAIPDRILCIAQVNTAAGRGPAYITECPPVMQRPARPR
jgi:hypothetical protein